MKLAGLAFVLAAGACVSAFAQQSSPIVLQLSWEHEFQFAGYYAAQWQGYYAEEGLDVEIRSAYDAQGNYSAPQDELLNGSADFGIGGQEALISRGMGQPFVVLSPIFQRSPIAVFSLSDTNIESPAALANLRIAGLKDNFRRVQLRTMMHVAGIEPSSLNFVEADASVDVLVRGEADAIITYDVSAYFRAQELGVELNVLRLDEHGVDFYGDAIYTTEAVLDASPETVRKFVRASLKGWLYALENPLEIADRISTELPRYIYQYNDVVAYNRYFAERINDYVYYPSVPLGHNQLERWEYAYSLLEQQGLVNEPFPVSDVYYYPIEFSQDPPERYPAWVLVVSSLTLAVLVIAFFRSKFLALMLLIPVLYLLLEQMIEQRYKNLVLEEQRLGVREVLGNIRYQLESQLSNNLSLINSLAAFIAANPDYSDSEFTTYAAVIVDRDPALINLAAAPDLVVTNIYPLEGNEAALGLNYRMNAEQMPAIDRMIRTEAMVLAGPVDLVQGGKAFIGRAPVYIDNEAGDQTLWGIVSAPIDETAVYAASDVFQPQLGLDIAIRGRDGLGADGDVFFGREQIFNNPEAVIMPVVIGGGTWQLGAVSYSNALQGNFVIPALRFAAFLAAALTLVAVFLRRTVLLREHRYEQLIFRNEQFLREVEAVSKVGGWRLDSEQVFTEMSLQCRAILGLEGENDSVTLESVCELFTPSTRDVISELMGNSLLHSDDFDTEIHLKKLDGQEMWLHIRGEVLALPRGKVELIGAIQDITKEKEADSLIEYQANFDSLTGLANRSLFRDRLELALAEAKRFSSKLAVLFIDLDNFKSVNDNLGHDVGDEVLIETSKRISDCVEVGSTVARYSGDEFIVLLTDIFSEVDVSRTVERIVTSVAEPYRLQMHQIYCGVSIGIAFFPDDAEDSDTIIIKADQAMYEVKNSGRNGWQFFTEEMQRKSEKRHDLFNELVAALNRDELEVFYQPIICPYSMRVAGCEALIRWRRADGGFVSPDEFIPLAEESGLVIRIDSLVLAKAKSFVSSLNDKLGLNLNLSVNASARLFHMRDDSSQVWFDEIKKPSNVPISIEITERVLVEDADRARSVLSELSEAGVRISIDDFGTGYSSLSYLSRFPVQGMKIDKSFVSKIGLLKTEESLIETMLLMAEKLDISVVAEGVETQQQLDFLKNAKCDLVQGYYLGKPMPEAEFRDFVKASSEKA
ncbi:MAG: EAL domain-containing protein [Pseudohongiellaceae bacterium]|nr:EAL domain-containing protein [Pseudohongiellaceae bacterium]